MYMLLLLILQLLLLVLLCFFVADIVVDVVVGCDSGIAEANICKCTMAYTKEEADCASRVVHCKLGKTTF